MYFVNPNVKNLYRTSYQDIRKDFIRLDMNENPEGLPGPFFNKVMSSVSPEMISMYPEKNDLIKKIAESLNYKAENIALTNGSDDAIRLLFEVFGEPGKKVISASPTFEMYSVYTKMYGLKYCPIEYGQDFRLNTNYFINSIDEDTSVVILLNPNSPIGDPWREEEVIMIIEKARENRAIVVIDEAYHYFYDQTFISLVGKYENVVVFRTFSKMLSIAGLRIGYAISNPDIIRFLSNASSTYPVNSLAIRFAEELMDHPDVIQSLKASELEGREWLLSKLRESEYEHYYNNGNYVLIRSNNDPKVIFTELKKRGILIKIYSYPILIKWIRITTGSYDTMNRFWNEFENIEKSLPC
ncbi:aminotransferase class I/II-fold pyridoxal phosphate-dependent enzyme [Paenibacillus marchantiae]|uniref:pyridoxal phosphate-dependent aminotransferase n=1 Tax=Paenibacillus TaxID=44249 RepID=UPI0022A97F01|nr:MULTISPECIES: aminotransferase class I/II-fold pyridoxal phosphate-dependent enzyme [Paenibacillus]MCZ1264087.1 aminotransferase class I/II-fold pyridoxal phosphate-dependent enzyme [Paenibacillus tundrae]WDQ33164.1 aminotransferase class I/II-fold pyridoxal phosphate-dependent enzyme [Paenibacillus marchantiae]